MGALRRSDVKSEVVAARRVESLVTEKFLDVSDRTSVEKEGRCHRVPENMRAEFLCDSASPARPLEDPLYAVVAQALRYIPLGHKQPLLLVDAALEIPPKPQERSITKNK